MAIRHDYLQNIEEQSLETKYIDLVLQGHAKWASQKAGPARPRPAGDIMGVVSVREGKYELTLSDDEFTMVDKAIARLADRLREIVELEYRNYFRGRFHHVKQEDKWRMLGLKRTAYSARLLGAQWATHQELLPDVTTWRERNLSKRDA